MLGNEFVLFILYLNQVIVIAKLLSVKQMLEYFCYQVVNQLYNLQNAAVVIILNAREPTIK